MRPVTFHCIVTSRAFSSELVLRNLQEGNARTLHKGPIQPQTRFRPAPAGISGGSDKNIIWASRVNRSPGDLLRVDTC